MTNLDLTPEEKALILEQRANAKTEEQKQAEQLLQKIAELEERLTTNISEHLDTILLNNQDAEDLVAEFKENGFKDVSLSSTETSITPQNYLLGQYKELGGTKDFTVKAHRFNVVLRYGRAGKTSDTTLSFEKIKCKFRVYLPGVIEESFRSYVLKTAITKIQDYNAGQEHKYQRRLKEKSHVADTLEALKSELPKGTIFKVLEETKRYEGYGPRSATFRSFEIIEITYKNGNQIVIEPQLNHEPRLVRKIEVRTKNFKAMDWVAELAK